MGVRFFHLISQYAVNVLFWDPWDFDDATLFQQHSIWEMFRWQHGWHRQGLGALLQKLIEPRIHWNGRYEAFFLGAVIVAVAVLALLLKMRLYGAIGCSDVIIPLLFLTPLQYEALVWSPNPSQCSLPLLLAIAPDGSLLLQLVNPHLSLEVHLHFAGEFFFDLHGLRDIYGSCHPSIARPRLLRKYPPSGTQVSV